MAPAAEADPQPGGPRGVEARAHTRVSTLIVSMIR